MFKVLQLWVEEPDISLAEQALSGCGDVSSLIVKRTAYGFELRGSDHALIEARDAVMRFSHRIRVRTFASEDAAAERASSVRVNKILDTVVGAYVATLEQLADTLTPEQGAGTARSLAGLLQSTELQFLAILNRAECVLVNHGCDLTEIDGL